jgi:hypothetical protein
MHQSRGTTRYTDVAVQTSPPRDATVQSKSRHRIHNRNKSEPVVSLSVARHSAQSTQHELTTLSGMSLEIESVKSPDLSCPSSSSGDSDSDSVEIIDYCSSPGSDSFFRWRNSRRHQSLLAAYRESENTIAQSEQVHGGEYNNTNEIDGVCDGLAPRPIPALHGPLSLPYARCPS